MKRVLIINDSRFERLFLRDMVAGLGFEAWVTDEFDSWRQLDILQPEMVIVNYTMSAMTGDKLIASIKEKCPSIICLLSSCSELNARDFPQVDGILHTPVRQEELKQLVQTLLVGRPEETETRALSDSAAMPYHFCPYCGQQLPVAGIKIAFCPYCGNRLV